MGIYYFSSFWARNLREAKWLVRLCTRGPAQYWSHPHLASLPCHQSLLWRNVMRLLFSYVPGCKFVIFWDVSVVLEKKNGIADLKVDFQTDKNLDCFHRLTENISRHAPHWPIVVWTVLATRTVFIISGLSPSECLVNPFPLLSFLCK